MYTKYAERIALLKEDYKIRTKKRFFVLKKRFYLELFLEDFLPFSKGLNSGE